MEEHHGIDIDLSPSEEAKDAEPTPSVATHSTQPLAPAVSALERNAWQAAAWTDGLNSETTRCRMNLHQHIENLCATVNSTVGQVTVGGSDDRCGAVNEPTEGALRSVASGAYADTVARQATMQD